MSARTVAVIPAHNEEANVANVVRETLGHVDAVLVVDDGSRDRTAEEAERAGARVFRLSPNRGKGGALSYGLAQARALGAARVVTLDADGEHVPGDVPALLAGLDAGADVVLGQRDVHRSGARAALNRLAIFWFGLLEPGVSDTICGFRAFRAEVLPALENDAGGFVYEHEVLLRAIAAGLRIAAVPVRIRSNDRSRVTPREILRANNHFDRRVLGMLPALRIPAWRKALLAAGCAAGLALGVPGAWVLGRKRAGGAKRAPGAA